MSRRLASFYFAYFAYAGVMLAFFPLYLAARGLQPGEIAFLVALPHIARTFAPAAWGWLADLTGARRGIVAFSCAASAVCLFLVPHAGTVATIALLVALMSLLSAAAVPLVEAITLSSLAGQAGPQLGKYGPIRVWGSVGFIAATLGGGGWLDWWPPSTLPPLLVALSLASLATAVALPPGAPRARVMGDTPPLGAGVRALFAAGFCMAAAHGTLYTFFTLHLERAGHSGTVIGALWTLGVLAEIVVFAASPRFTLPPAMLVMISASCAVVRWVITAQAPPIAILAPVQLMHGLTFGLTQVGIMNLMVHHVPGHIMARGQGFLAACAGIVTGSAYILSGAVFARYGQNVYYVMAAIAACGGLVMWSARHRLMNHPQSAASGG